MKQSFKSTLKQTPSFSPQQQQAVKILQLGSVALSQQIQQALKSNPFLETLETTESESQFEVKNSKFKPQSLASGINKQPFSFAASHPQSGNSELTSEIESIGYAAASLHSHLHQQAIRTPMSERQHLAVECLIDSLEETGYLGTRLQEIAHYTQDKEGFSLAELESALRQVQALEPVGVGCRNLSECLCIQLRNIKPASSITQLALTLVEQHLKSLGKSHRKALGRALNTDALSLQQATALIKKLDPKPGGQIHSPTTIYISADILVTKHGGRWQAELNREHVPQIALSGYTQNWLDQIKEPAQKKPLLEQANKAKLLLAHVENRYQTTLRVATQIVSQQQAYFDQGNLALQPLTLKQIADSLNLHISTVSRTVNGKYLLSNKGLIELKYFFSAAISNRNGEQSSARSVQATIAKMIQQEPSNKPLSDNKITQRLNETGLQVARRTVAKYREQLNIPASSVRRQLSNPSGDINLGNH